MFSSILPALVALPFILALPILQPRQATDCADVVTIFARGTTEPGTIGITVGPALRRELQATLGTKTLSFQGVDYPANVAGAIAGGDAQGSQTMADMVEQTAIQCPGSKIVMSGYSQGAQLVHNAAGLVSSSAATAVSAVVMFGDPENGQPLGNGLDDNSTTFCNNGDAVCDGKFIILPPHLAYATDGSTQKAADFISTKV
ncbi:cutinase [Flagelloscypha sp. PMI_526]|nr:cutinase [Flagelloscypha sp. PMI_526]